MDKQAAKASLKFSPVKLDKLKILVKKCYEQDENWRIKRHFHRSYGKP